MSVIEYTILIHQVKISYNAMSAIEYTILVRQVKISYNAMSVIEYTIPVRWVDTPYFIIYKTNYLFIYLLLNHTRSTEYSMKINNLISQLARANVRDNVVQLVVR